MRQTNVLFGLKRLGQPVGEEKKGEKKRKRRKKREKNWDKTKPRYVFILKSWVFWIPKVLVWRFVPSFLGFCGRDHPNPRFVEVMWVKPHLVKNKHGIHQNYMVLYRISGPWVELLGFSPRVL